MSLKKENGFEINPQIFDFYPSSIFQMDKPASRTKPKKAPTTATAKMAKKAKEKLIPGLAKKKTSVSTPETTPEGTVTKKSKEISNRLAEAKH